MALENSKLGGFGLALSSLMVYALAPGKFFGARSPQPQFTARRRKTSSSRSFETDRRILLSLHDDDDDDEEKS